MRSVSNSRGNSNPEYKNTRGARTNSHYRGKAPTNEASNKASATSTRVFSNPSLSRKEEYTLSIAKKIEEYGKAGQVDLADKTFYEFVEENERPSLKMVIGLFKTYLQCNQPSRIKKLVETADANLFLTANVDKIYHIYTPSQECSEEFLDIFLRALKSKETINSTNKIRNILKSHPQLALLYPEFAGPDVMNSIQSQGSATQTTSISSQPTQVIAVDIFSLFDPKIASDEEQAFCQELEYLIFESHQKDQATIEEAFNNYIQRQYKPSLEMITNLIRIFSCNDQPEKIKQLMSRFDPKVLTDLFWLDLFCSFDKIKEDVRMNNSKSVKSLLDFLEEKKISLEKGQLDFIFRSKYKEHAEAYSKYIKESSKDICVFFGSGNNLKGEPEALKNLTEILKKWYNYDRNEIENEFNLHLQKGFRISSEIICGMLRMYSSDAVKVEEFLSRIKLDLFTPTLCCKICRTGQNDTGFLYMFLIFLEKNGIKINNKQLDSIFNSQSRDLKNHYLKYKAKSSV